ncbi:GAF domain-containing protein [Nocardia sp. NPDC059246]|uniref:GAF domain-containing protein n=1 Tax=unclassified Nocardia TaxID=2637762 RepID=UPI003692F992
MSTPEEPAIEASAPASQRTERREVPWALVETLFFKDRGSVVAEGASRRYFTRLLRTRLAQETMRGPHVARSLQAIVDDCVAAARPVVRAVHSPVSPPLRVLAVPVLDGTDAVMGVQLWGGPRRVQPPPRPLVATLTWDSRTQLLTGSASLEQLLGTGEDRSRSRALPDFLRHFEQIDRTGLLRLFDPQLEPDTWSSTAVSAGQGDGIRRHLHFAARSDGFGQVRALVHDIGTASETPTPQLQSLLLRAVPLSPDHAVGVMDLRTGLIHEWLAPASSPLHRATVEVPRIHPDDIGDCVRVRKELLAGATHRHIDIRVSFDQQQWLHLSVHWHVLARGTVPQAMWSVLLR